MAKDATQCSSPGMTGRDSMWAERPAHRWVASVSSLTSHSSSWSMEVENEKEEILLGLFRRANAELINVREIICNSTIPTNDFVADWPRRALSQTQCFCAGSQELQRESKVRTEQQGASFSQAWPSLSAISLTSTNRNPCNCFFHLLPWWGGKNCERSSMHLLLEGNIVLQLGEGESRVWRTLVV